MVPLVSAATIGGVPVANLVEPEALARIIEHTRKAGAEVVGLLKTGSAFVSPAASVIEMVKAVLLDERRVMPQAACGRSWRSSSRARSAPRSTGRPRQYAGGSRRFPAEGAPHG